MNLYSVNSFNFTHIIHVMIYSEAFEIFNGKKIAVAISKVKVLKDSDARASEDCTNQRC